MLKRLSLIGGLLLVLMVPLTALAQGPVPEHSDLNWQASYWNNMTLSGPPVLERPEPNLDYSWGVGSPDPSVRTDQFSARWTRYIDVTPGTFRFTATSDDGMRVSVDGAWIINEWNDHSAKTVSVDRNLSAGHHLVVVEYYENLVDAVARVSWAPVTTITEWRGAYFANKTLSGSPTLVRNDKEINFAWGTGSPAQGMPADSFSVRWTRSIAMNAGSYRFTVTVDDGVRLWVNGHLLIDAWKDQVSTYTGTIYLPGGNIPVKMEYYENTGGATARLSIAGEGVQSNTVIVDDTDPGFAKGGSVTGWHAAAEGYGSHLFWTKNNDKARPNYDWGRWYPKLAPGRYEVFVYIPYRYTTSATAQYWISHAGGLTLRVVNQSAYGNQWVSLGTYQFQGNSKDYLSLADVTYEPYLSRIIAWDAAKWESR